MIEINSSSRYRDEIAAAIGLAVMQWQDATQAYDEAVGARLGLNMAERHCIGLLYGGPQSAGAVAKATGLTPAAVTALIDRLEARGLVQRRLSPQDQRVKQAFITPAGRELLRKTREDLDLVQERLFAPLTANEQDTLLALLAKLVGAHQTFTHPGEQARDSEAL